MTDFNDGDLIALAKDAFRAIGPLGEIFHAGDFAETRAQKILYDERSGWLSYAEKGSKTADPVAFAKIGKHLDLDHTDILMI